MLQAELHHEGLKQYLQQADDVIKDFSVLDEAGHQTHIQESRSSLTTTATRLSYLLNHFSALKTLHQKILQDFHKACVELAPDNVPTVKLPTPASEPESSQTAEPITI